MASTTTAYVGARAPEALQITITPEAGADPLDLSTVTACSLRVQRQPNGPVQFWTTAIVSQSAAQLVVAHAFAEGDDVDRAGDLVVMPYLTVPGGVRRSSSITLKITRI